MVFYTFWQIYNHQEVLNMKRKCMSAILSVVILLSALPQTALPAAAAKVKTLGDVNADGSVNVSDGVALSRYVAQWDDITIDKDAADLNQDGEIKKEDSTILVRYLAGWDGYDKYIQPITLAEEDPLRIEAQPKPFTIDYGEDAKLSVTAAGGTAPYTYQWLLNGEDIDGATKAVYVPVKGGNYRCVITDDDGATVFTQNTKCAIHPIIVTQPIDGDDQFQVLTAGGTNLSYHWEKDVLGEWRVQRESYGAGYGATSVGKYRCVITDFDGYELISDVVRWYGKGELTVSDIYLDPDEDANYGLTIDFTHQKFEHFRYPRYYWLDGVRQHVTYEEVISGEYPEGAEFTISVLNNNRHENRSYYYDYNVPVCSPYAASGLYGDYLDLYVDATGEGPLFFDWQLSPTFEQALAGKGFVSIKKESGALGLGTEHLRFPMTENEDIVHCYGYVRCIVTDRNGNSKTAVFGNPWAFDHDTYFTTPNLLEYAGGGPHQVIINGEIRRGGFFEDAFFWYRDGAQELALWGCKAPTFKEVPEETVSGAELPLNPLADVPTAPIVDTDFSGEIIGTRDAMWNCGYLKLDEDGNPTDFAEVFTSNDSYQFGEFSSNGVCGEHPSEYKCCMNYDWRNLDDADKGIPSGIIPRNAIGSDKYEICRRDGTYLPAVALNLYQYNMHEPDCRKPHDKRIWFGDEFISKRVEEVGAYAAYNLGNSYWWLYFSEPIYAPWYTEKVRYLYAYGDHPVTVKNPESYMVIVDDIDLEQAESGDPDNIVTYLKKYDEYKTLSAEDLKAMLPLRFDWGDCNHWQNVSSDGWIDSLFTKTGGHMYCVCEYADGTTGYYHSTPLDIGCTVTLTGIGTYTASDSASADPIAQILDLDDFSLEDAKKALPYQLKTGMDSYSALRAAEKLKKLGLEVTVTLDGASLPETEKDEWIVTLESYDTERALDTIKAYRDVMQAITGESIPLASAKATIQSAPCVLTEKATKEQAEQIKTALEGVGAAVTYAAYEGGGS